MRLTALLSTTFLVLSPLVSADITSAEAATATGDVAVPTPAASGAAPLANTQGYSYAGCWNETTWRPGGYRALKDGTMISNRTQTTDSCMAFCKGNNYQYCGMEYGSECWGSRYFNTLSEKLPESNCSIGCGGNNTEVCGGTLTITLYNHTGDSSSSSGGSSSSSDKKGAASKEVTGAVGAVLLAAAMGLAFSAF